MNVQISFVLLLAASVISSQENDGDKKKARKHYGLTYHSKCADYVQSFTCMTTCQSMGFQVFRMDFRCKCSCHELKTTTILPFFKWRTKGTTKTLPSTHSPELYHIYGTLSPARSENDATEIIETISNVTAIICEPIADNSTASNGTAPDDDSASDNATTVDDGSPSPSSTTVSTASAAGGTTTATTAAAGAESPASEATPQAASDATTASVDS